MKTIRAGIENRTGWVGVCQSNTNAGDGGAHAADSFFHTRGRVSGGRCDRGTRAREREQAARIPDLIQLPSPFQPERIEIGKGTTFYVGSVASGAIYRGNLRTSTGSVLVPGGASGSATGIELDNHDRLFVAGAATGSAYVYDARSGKLLRTYNLAAAPTFINDVVVTHDAAYFTDSFNPVLYKIAISGGGEPGPAQTIALGGEYAHVPDTFSLNGIDATPNGKELVAVIPAAFPTRSWSCGSPLSRNVPGVIVRSTAH